MKKLLIVSSLAFSLALSAAPLAASAQTVNPGQHRRPVAGFVDSVSNKGAWVLETSIERFGLVSYVAQNPTTPEESRIKALWQVAIAQFLR